MGFHKANTWLERGQQLDLVKKKCNLVIKHLGLGENKNDARSLTMIHVRQLCNTVATVPIRLLCLAEKPGNHGCLLSLLGLSKKEHLETLLTDLNNNSKLSFITMAQFVLENGVNRVLDAIPGEHSCSTFCKSIQRLAAATGIDGKKKKLLMVPQYIRNSLHAHGVHGNASNTITVDGEDYVFEKGKRLSCGSWSHLFHVVCNVLPVYEEMFTSPKVASIAHIPAASAKAAKKQTTNGTE